MAQGLFTRKQHIQGIAQKAWISPSTYAGLWGGNNSTYLSFTGNSTLAFGTGDFTIEGWFYRAGSVSSSGLIAGGGAGNWAVLMSNTTLYFQNSQSVSNLLAITATMLQNTWYHLAVVRSSGTTTMYLNGNSIGSATDSTNYSAAAPTYYIGANPDNLTTYNWNGYLSNIRVTKGTALYTANFIIPSAPLANISGTQFLGLQNATIGDNSSNAFSITASGIVSVQRVFPFTQISTPAVDYLVVAGGGGGGTNIGAGGGAGGLLQGSVLVTAGSALTVTVGAGGAAEVNGGNSVFLSIAAVGGGKGGNGSGSAGNAGGSGGGTTLPGTLGPGQGTFLQGNSGGTSSGVSAGNDYGSGGGGGAGTAGINGIQSKSGDGGAGIASAISGTVTTYAGGGGATSSAFNTGGSGGVGGGGAGANNASYPFSGSNGTANTGGGGGGGTRGGGTGGNGGSGIVIVSYPDIYAGAASVTGSPTVSTSGSGSISFNGSTDYLSVASTTALAFGTNNFTIEFWAYLNTTSGAQIIYSSQTSGSYTVAPDIYQQSGKLYVQVSSTNPINGTGPTTLVANRWYHIALVRSSGTSTLYVNGVSEASFADSNTYVIGANRPVIGVYGYNPTVYYLNGYVSNLRVVNGTALYTGAFTPSTTPLTLIANTSLLLNTVSGAQFADSSTNSFTLSRSGTPAWNQSSPFGTGLGYKNRVYTWSSSGSVTF
jgi:hypothetical protein